MQLKSAITVETKTFNNYWGFERGLWAASNEACYGRAKKERVWCGLESSTL
jgi:hypothetical protein